MKHYKILVVTCYDTFELDYDTYRIALQEFKDWKDDVSACDVKLDKIIFDFDTHTEIVHRLHHWNVEQGDIF